MKETNEYFMFLSEPMCADAPEERCYATICQMGVPFAVCLCL